MLATDASAGMIDVAVRRGIDAIALRAEDVGELATLGPFDGVLSNFGGLNCVADLGVFVDGMAACLRPGGTALLCIMGPTVPWEWIWYLLHGQPRTAFRRFSPVTQWRGIEIRYPSIRTMRRLTGTAFDVTRVWALGALIPPSYAEEWAARHPRLLASLGASNAGSSAGQARRTSPTTTCSSSSAGEVGLPALQDDARRRDMLDVR